MAESEWWTFFLKIGYITSIWQVHEGSRCMQYLPNLITITRILLTPVILLLLAWPAFYAQVFALLLFILVAISDWLDGKLARMLQVSSRLGKFLDPLADKVLVLGVFLTLPIVLPGLIPWWAVITIALRDLIVTGLRLYAERRKQSLPTFYSAKVKTTVQLSFLILTLLLNTLRYAPGNLSEIARTFLFSPVYQLLLYGVVLFTVVTGIQYIQYVRAQHTTHTR